MSTAEPGRWQRWRDLATGGATPSRLLRFAALLVIGCLATALASGLTGTPRSEAVGSEGTRLAALDFDAAELYRSLNGANASAATGFGADRTVSPTMLARYDSYVTGAYLRLVHAASLLGQDDAADTALTERISYDLPRYTSGVDRARSLRDQGSPAAQAELDSADALMASTLLPTAETLQQHRRAALADTYRQAGAFPVVVVLLAVLTLIAITWVAVRESRRTKRVVSIGLYAAAVLLTATLIWWLTATIAAASHLADASAADTAATELSRAQVTLLQARAAETTTVADSGPGGPVPEATAGLERDLAVRFAQVTDPGGLLDTAHGALVERFGSGPGTPEPTDAVRTATDAWRSSLTAGGPGSDDSRARFVQLSAALDDGISTEEGRRTDAVTAAAGILNGIAIGPTVLAVLAALAAALGMRRRLLEYR